MKFVRVSLESTALDGSSLPVVGVFVFVFVFSCDLSFRLIIPLDLFFVLSYD